MIIRTRDCSALTYQSPSSSLSEGPVVVSGHLNGVSDSGLIETNRGGFVSSQDPQPLPVPLLWEQARVTQAVHLHSIPPLLSLWKGYRSHTLILPALHKSSQHVSGDRKSIFGIQKDASVCAFVQAQLCKPDQDDEMLGRAHSPASQPLPRPAFGLCSV